jgi:hypothetical protein
MNEENTNNQNFMSILNNSNIDKILKNDEMRSNRKSAKQFGGKIKKEKSPATSDKSMSVNYNPDKAHQIFDMTESDDGQLI